MGQAPPHIHYMELPHAALKIQKAWTRHVHAKFVSHALKLKNLDICRIKSQFRPFEFRAYMFSTPVSLILYNFTFFLSKILVLMKHQRRFHGASPKRAHAEESSCQINREFRNLLFAYKDQIASAYIHACCGKQILTSLEFPETEMEIERDLWSVSQTFVNNLEAFLLHIGIRTKQNDQAFFFEDEEYLMDTADGQIETVILSFKDYISRHFTWKDELKQMRLFTLENAIYAVEKMKCLKHLSLESSRCIEFKYEFYKAKYMESICHLPNQAEVWKSVQDNMLKVKKGIEVDPKGRIPQRLIKAFTEMKNPMGFSTEQILHEVLINVNFQVSCRQTPDDLNFSHIFDDMHSELEYALHAVALKKPYSLVCLRRFLHQLQEEFAKIEVFQEEELHHHSATRLQVSDSERFQAPVFFHEIQQHYIEKFDPKKFIFIFQKTVGNFHIALLAMCYPHLYSGIKEMDELKKIWPNIQQKLRRPDLFSEKGKDLDFIIDCFAFLFDELNAVKTISTNNKISINALSIHRIGITEECLYFQERHHTETPRLKEHIAKTLDSIEGHSNDQLSEILCNDAKLAKFIQHVCIRIVCLDVHSIFCHTHLAQADALEENPANLIPSVLGNTYETSKLAYPETLDLDTEKLNVLRTSTHNAIVYLSFFHTILEFAKTQRHSSTFFNIIHMENFFFDTEVLTVPLFATFLKEKTSFQETQVLHLTQAFILALDKTCALYQRMKGTVHRFWADIFDTNQSSMQELEYMRDFAAACCVKFLKPKKEILDKIIDIQIRAYGNIYLEYVKNIMAVVEE